MDPQLENTIIFHTASPLIDLNRFYDLGDSSGIFGHIYPFFNNIFINICDLAGLLELPKFELKLYKVGSNYFTTFSEISQDFSLSVNIGFV